METKDYFDAYIGHVLEHGEAPASVHSFCKVNGVAEADFFKQFGSFDVLESEFWESEVHAVVAAIRGGGEWESFDARQKMLTFLYALVARALERRSFLLVRFGGLAPLARPAWLAGWHVAVRDFAKSLVDEGIASGEIAERGRVHVVYPEALVVLARSVLDYFVRDTSKGFEKTDAYIEKACALAFDLMRTQALDSAFDLLRFLVPSPAGRRGGVRPAGTTAGKSA